LELDLCSFSLKYSWCTLNHTRYLYTLIIHCGRLFSKQSKKSRMTRITQFFGLSLRRDRDTFLRLSLLC
jgi:hypothetical protein